MVLIPNFKSRRTALNTTIRRTLQVDKTLSLPTYYTCYGEARGYLYDIHQRKKKNDKNCHSFHTTQDTLHTVLYIHIARYLKACASITPRPSAGQRCKPLNRLPGIHR